MNGAATKLVLSGMAAVIAVVAMAAGFSRTAPVLPPLASVVPPTPDRIRYGTNHLPSILLPDGRREVVRSLLNRPEAMHFGDYAWDDKTIPAGPVWVRVDLAGQTLSVFRAGHEIGTAVILYGTDGNPTPTGAFRVREMAKMHWSRSYDAPMPFMLRLTDDGVAIHASNVRQGFATHGCIGVPPDFARLLFAQMHSGDLVVIAPAGASAT